MANIKITDLVALTDPASTDVLPIVDVGADVTKKISIADLLENAGSGTASAPGIAFDGDPDTGIYSPGANQLAISTNGTGRLFVDADGRVRAITTGLGINKTSQAGFDLDVNGTSVLRGAVYLNSIRGVSGDTDIRAANNQALVFETNSTERLRITSDGKLGLGTSSPQTLLQAVGAIESISSNTYRGLRLEAQDSNYQVLKAHNYLGADYSSQIQFQTMDGTSVTTAATIDQIGRVGIGTTSPGAKLDVNGSLSKSSGSFKIDHPLPEKNETHYLVHSFVEAPDASNLYAGMVDLVDGVAVVNIDTAHRMSEGTFEALNTIQSWSSSNESGYAPVKCSIVGNLLTIECQDLNSNDTVYYEVRGIRKDVHMLSTEWTDEEGRVITEPLKEQPVETA